MIGEETFHPDTRALLAYGRALAGQGAAKAARAPRRDADALANRLVVMDHGGDGRLVVRAFGSDLVALFGKDLRNTDFAQLWRPAERGLITGFAAAVQAAGMPGVICGLGESVDGFRIGAELLLTPLRTEFATPDRLLGMFQPLGGEGLLNGRAIAHLRLAALHLPDAPVVTGPRLVVNNS